MASDEEDAKRFNEIIAQANSKLQLESTRLMDVHHESIQYARKVIQELRVFQDRYEEIISTMIETHSIAAREFADLYGDVIAGELGIVEVTEDEENEEEDE